MEQKYTDKDETFLARWLNKELTKEELSSFEKTDEFKEYQKIISKVALFEAPSFNKQKVFKAIQEKTQEQQKSKVRKLVPNWVMAAAASIAILFGVFYFMNTTNTVYETSYGEQLAVVLPDGSEVQLNAKSELSLDKEDWKKGVRKLSLKGEGYFKVQKGSKFTVETKGGSVAVLGTQFNVRSTKGYFEVLCYEGKVSVDSDKVSVILLPGKAFTKLEGKNPVNSEFKETAPSWISGETTFQKVPLKYVIKELEKLYQININLEEAYNNQLFTGSFTNTNKETALKTVCIPMGLQYVFENETKVTIGKN